MVCLIRCLPVIQIWVCVSDQPASDLAETRDLVLGDRVIHIHLRHDGTGPGRRFHSFESFSQRPHMGKTVMNLTSDDAFIVRFRFTTAMHLRWLCQAH